MVFPAGWSKQSTSRDAVPKPRATTLTRRLAAYPLLAGPSDAERRRLIGGDDVGMKRNADFFVSVVKLYVRAVITYGFSHGAPIPMQTHKLLQFFEESRG